MSSTESAAGDRQADAIERQADALEAIATELRYQNAVLVEHVDAIDQLAGRIDEHHGREPRTRSGTALQTAIADRLFERNDLEDSPMSSLRFAENWTGRDGHGRSNEGDRW